MVSSIVQPLRTSDAMFRGSCDRWELEKDSRGCRSALARNEKPCPPDKSKAAGFDTERPVFRPIDSISSGQLTSEVRV